MAKQWKSGKKKRKEKTKGERRVRSGVHAGLSASTRRGGGTHCGNGGDLTLAPNNGIKEADI